MRYRFLLSVLCWLTVSAGTPALSLAQGLLPPAQVTDHWAIDLVPSLHGDAVRVPSAQADVSPPPAVTGDTNEHEPQTIDHDVVEMNKGDVKLVTPALVDEVRRVQLYVRDTSLYVDADIDFALSNELRDAAYKGVPLHFTADIEIAQPRSWWFDKKIVKESQTWRVVYNALTRQWRVGTGEFLVPESSLADALLSVQHLRGWAIAPVDEFSLQKRYYGRIRLRLDTSFFNRPFQVDAMNSHVWSLATPWKDFDFSISDGEPLP